MSAKDPKGVPASKAIARTLVTKQGKSGDAIAAKRLLKSKDAAQYLAISERKMWELGNRGVIPVVRPDHRMVRFDVADLDAFIARKKKGGPSGKRTR